MMNELGEIGKLGVMVRRDSMILHMKIRVVTVMEFLIRSSVVFL